MILTVRCSTSNNILSNYAYKQLYNMGLLSKKEKEKLTLRERVKQFITRVKSLQGDPNYIAKGMAIGVFIGVTPTIPFHTASALFLSFVFKGSKAAAATGVWICNPITVPIFYLGSYKIGAYLFNLSIDFEPEFRSITEILELGVEIALAMMVGGVLMGLPLGVISYFVTLKLFKQIRERKKKLDTAK